MGYTGGTIQNPAYASLGDHSEALQIDYDPERISYRDLLDIFWSSHDPTIKSWSRQYRAAIFYHNDYQKHLALETRNDLASTSTSEIITDISAFTEFYPAEDYHQKHALQHSYEYLQEFKAMYPSFQDIVGSTAAARVNGYLGGYGTLQILQAELASYGLSAKVNEHLLNVAKASARYPCKGTGICSL